MLTHPYGPHPEQVGDLYLPQADHAPLVCLFHGGFWRMPHGRDQLHAIAKDLSTVGLAVWNLGYRRVGPGGHPWPATLEDAEAALAFLPALQRSHPQVDLDRLFLAGHSAGGHLAFWAASRAKQLPSALAPLWAVGLAPLLDLAAVHAAGLGDGAVELFLGGSPTELPDRYRLASPRALLPLGIRQYIIHGDADVVVPPRFSQAYSASARSAGDDIRTDFLPGIDHMAFLDPASAAHQHLRRWLQSAA